MILGTFRAIPFPDWISDTVFTLGPLSVKWYGLAYIVGLFGAYFYAKITSANKAVWQAKDATTTALVPNKRMLEDFMFFCLIGIIVGGRLGFIILYDLGTYISDPIRIFKVWQGGMSFHGGFLGVVVATIYMARSRKIPLMRMADLAAISAPIGIGLVRLANFVNQELYGRVTDVPWAFIFKGSWQPRHPSQLYEAFLEGVVIFCVLWLATRKFKILTRPGIATGLFLVMYGLFRFLVEYVREPDAGREQFGFLTRGQAYSLPMLIIGVLVVVWAMKRSALAPEWPKDEDEKPAKKA